MKKCNDCNIEMIENTNLHTDYVGGISFEEQIYLSFVNERIITKRVKARACQKCGKVELYIDLNKEK